MGYILNCPEEVWSTNYLVEQIYITLISTVEKDGITPKYQKRARWLLRRFALWDPPPEFLVYRRDLSYRILKELSSLRKSSPKALDYVMTRAIEMIFEGITEQDEEIFNYNHYLFSVKRYRVFRWRFDNKEEDDETDSDSKYEVNYVEFDSNGLAVGGILDKRERR